MGMVSPDPITARMPITKRNVVATRNAASPAGKLEAELSASLSDPDRNIQLAALKQIGNLGHGEYGIKPQVNSSTIQILKRVAVSEDPELEEVGYASLIKLENYDLLQPASRFVESGAYQSGDIIRAINEIGDIRLREAKKISDDPDIECSSKTDLPFDRSALQVLHSMVSSTHLEMRRSAVHALRGICDPSSAGILVRALDDNDRKTQYDALQGLAAMEDFPVNRPAPSTRDFNMDPAKYVKDWKSWWTTAGVRKYEENQ